MTAIDTRISRQTAQPARGVVASPPSISESRRSNVIAAVERLVRARGVDRIDVGTICRATGVSPAYFRAEFGDVEQCLLVVFDQASAKACAAMTSAYTTEHAWDAGVRAAVCALLTFLDDRPGLARFLVVDSLWGPPVLRARREEMLSSLAGALGRGSPLGPPNSSPIPYGPDAVVRAVVSIVHARLRAEPDLPLGALHGALMAMSVLPYLGPESARHELARQ